MEKLAGHEEAATSAVKQCRRALERIKAGIGLIESDPLAEEAFRFANRAMWRQRIHSTFSRKVRKKEMTVEDGVDVMDVAQNRSWRLFQMAFILLNLPSLTDLHHPDRSHETEAVADLLWFATGGGKTEAYLGLTAYTLAMRRLQGEVEGRRGDHGIAVLMRYTLRLLTLQQFQRAAALICACETIRRENVACWGEVPFRLGLWVGNKTMPNTLSAAANALRQRNIGGRPTGSGTPRQITSCPWCGSEIREQHIRVYEAPGDIGRCVTYCGDDLGRCAFTENNAPKEGLPAVGVPVVPFPRWMRCSLCQTLATVESGVFKLLQDPYRPDNTEYVHQGCLKSQGNRPPSALSVRFLLACREGHLTDFP